MVPIDLKEVIAGGETYTVEFKGDVGDDELVEAVVCFGNGDGGLVLIGVDDSFVRYHFLCNRTTFCCIRNG